MAEIGYWALLLTLIVSVYATIGSYLGASSKYPKLVKSAGNAVLATGILVTLATAILLYLLISHDFQVQYVHQHSSTHMSLAYTVSALWAGQEGSLLLWLWLLAVLAIVLVRQGQTLGRMGLYLVPALAATEAFLTLVLVAVSNPFQTYPMRPPEGVGMLPLLENPGMILHPPILFLGYAGYTAPFAFSLAALISGELEGDWVAAARRWSLFAWTALGLGILIGAWWSYAELGWGGYWAWDPVENSSLIPWLTGTALVHSMVMAERRKMHRVWIMVLPVTCFILCLFATLVTRGGIIVSDLHGFSSSLQPIAYYLIAFILLVLGTAMSLIYVRRSLFTGRLKVENPLSREGAFLLTNLLLCGIALVVFLGTIYPSLSSAIRGVQIVLGESFYNRATVPLGMALVGLMGVCLAIDWKRVTNRNLRSLLYSVIGAIVCTTIAFILGVDEAFSLISIAICSLVILSIMGRIWQDASARRHSTGDNYPKVLVGLWRKAQRRYGAYIVHLGVVLMAMGIMGSMVYKSDDLITMQPGEFANIGKYQLRYENYSTDVLNAEPVTYQSRIRYATTLGLYEGDSKVGSMVAEKNYHWALDTPWVTEVAIHSNLLEDVYIVLANLEEDGLAGFEVVINPLVVWIWIGGGMLIAGTFVAAWPNRRSVEREV